MQPRTDLARSVRWGIKSVGGLAANLGLLTVWVEWAGFAAWWAIGINWLLISLGGYLVTDQWVFGETPSPAGLVANARRFVAMQSVMGAGKLVNYLVYVALLPVADYRIAWLVGAALTFLATFSGNRWLWSRVAEGA